MDEGGGEKAELKPRKETKEEKAERDKVFGKAALRARAMMRSRVLGDGEMAQLMGLFQQATQGDGSNWKLLNDPNFFVSSDGMKKNMTWLPLRGMAKTEARDKYIDLVESLMTKHGVVFPLTPAPSFASIASTSTQATFLSRP